MGSLLKKVSKNVAGVISESISQRIPKEEIVEIALSAGISFVQSVITKKGITTNIEFIIESALFNHSERKEIPENAMVNASAIRDIFMKTALVPERIAIDGVPGSGKSSLSRALGKILDMKPVCLDHYRMNEAINFISKPAVFEHHRLLRTQDIDCFDAIIYIDEPVEYSKEKILQRKRGSYLVDIMDFDLMKKIGKKAFALADGEFYSVPNSYIKMKIKNGNSYHVFKNIADELKQYEQHKKYESHKEPHKSDGSYGFRKYNMDMDMDNIETIDKESLIFLLEEGKATKGFTAYLNPVAYKEDFIKAVKSAVRSKKKLTKRFSASR